MEIPITPAQLTRWRNGELIQNVAPDLTPSQREFLISGVTDEEWERDMKSPSSASIRPNRPHISDEDEDDIIPF